MPDTLLMELVLQHLAANPWPDTNYAALISKLLLVSKLTRQSLALYCSGKFPISARIRTNQRATLFATWLRQPTLASSGHIMKSLNFILRCPNRAAAEAAITAALQQAASAAPGGRLLLQSFSSSTPTAAMLQQLSSSCNITSMKLDFGQETLARKVKWTRNRMQELGQALAGLQSLCSLELTGTESIADVVPGSVDEVVKQLTALTNLTSLKLGYTTEQQCLPPQLQQLTYSGLEIDPEDYQYIYDICGPLGAEFNMGHLTALTQLTYKGGVTNDGDRHWYDRLDKYSVLPPNLQVLDVEKCVGFDALLQLQQLRVLTLRQCYVHAECLQQLNKLNSLQEVHLWCAEDEYVHDKFYGAKDSALSWKDIPLKTLSCAVDLTAAAAEVAAAALQGSSAGSSAGNSGGNSSSAASSRRSFYSRPNESVSDSAFLQQLSLQTGLTQLHLSVSISSTEAEAVTQLNLLIQPLQQLRELRELDLSLGGTFYSFYDTSRNNANSGAQLVNIAPYRPLACVICALPKLDTVTLSRPIFCGSCSGLVPAVQAEIRAAGCSAKLVVDCSQGAVPSN